MLAPASTNDVGVDRTKIDGSCEKGLAEMEGGAVPATNDDGSSTNMATTPSSQMEATAAESMAARDVGSSTPHLKAGDSVSIESTHFDAPGRPGSYSAGAPARAFGGVVLGRTRAGGCFTVMWRGGEHPMESHWKHLRLEPEDASVPKQHEGETAPAFRRRV